MYKDNELKAVHAIHFIFVLSYFKNSILNFNVQNLYVYFCTISASVGAEVVEPGSEDNTQSLKYRVGKIRELRNEVDKLRGIISNKYAEDMGENLNCTTQ